MPFSDSLTIATQIQALMQERHPALAPEFFLALDRIALIQASPLRDSVALADTHRLLNLAKAQSRFNPRPYFALAHLFLLGDDPPQAISQLKRALQVDPWFEPARQLLTELEASQQSEPAQQADSASSAIPHDADSVYETVRALIRTTLRQMLLRPVKPVPVLSGEGHDALWLAFAQLDELRNRLHLQLEVLEQEMDTHHLHQQIKPIDELLQRYQRALELSASFRHLNDEIQALFTEARRVQDQFINHPHEEPESFHQLLDDCDALADRLDAHKAQDQDISPIEPAYLELLAFIAHLQEMFDEGEG